MFATKGHKSLVFILKATQNFANYLHGMVQVADEFTKTLYIYVAENRGAFFFTPLNGFSSQRRFHRPTLLKCSQSRT